MRPLELKLRNFRSYFGESGPFDFRDRRLVGVVGPIGSGKSSLLDAIAFALYGRTPSVAANTKSLIHQRADEATVSLRFEVDGEVWEAVRMLRRKGASQHALYRYAADGDEEAAEKILLEGEVNSRVSDLLGLEYEAFAKSVLLAQGRFAEFLRARPAERDKVLKGVFGHDRIDAMREAARSRSSVVAVEIEKLNVRLEQVDKLQGEIERLRAQIVDTEQRLAVLEKSESEVRALDERFAKADQASGEAGRTLNQLLDHESRFPDPEAAQRVISNAAAAGEVRRSCAAALESARAAQSLAERAVTDSEEAGEPQLIEEAAAMIARLEPLRSADARAAKHESRLIDRLGNQRKDADAAGSAVEEAKREVDDATAGADAAGTTLESATEAFHEAQHAEMAAELRAGLETGTPCPVCEQQVATLPPQMKAPELDRARTDHEAAMSRFERERKRSEGVNQHLAVVRAAHEEASKSVTVLEGEREAAKVEATAARAAVEGLQSDLTALLGDGVPGELLDRRRSAVAGLAAAAAGSREAVDRSRADHDQAIRDEQDSGKALSSLRVDLADLAARVGVSTTAADAGPEGVATQLEGLREAWVDAKKAAEASMVRAAEERDAASAARDVLLAEIGIERDFSTALGETKARRDLVRADLDRNSKELASSVSLQDERDHLVAGKGNFDRVAADLTDARFVRYLLDDERARLAALGSDHFLRLSSGRYLFSADGNFNIVDQTSAGAVRKAESLSGGETFLASLALALALAEMVARTGGRLDAFFLDEGFGSLDPEHLDLAMDGVEALVAGSASRLVVVVSHVPELRDRIEDLIELERDAVTGDTRVISA